MATYTYNSFQSLENALKASMKQAMSSIEQKAHMAAMENAEKFYSVPGGNYYIRTGTYGDAPDSTGVTGNGTHLEATIYMNPDGHGYRTGTFSAQEVWEAVETHSHGVLGLPNRWAETEQEIEKIIQDEFSKIF